MRRRRFIRGIAMTLSGLAVLSPLVAFVAVVGGLTHQRQLVFPRLVAFGIVAALVTIVSGVWQIVLGFMTSKDAIVGMLEPLPVTHALDAKGAPRAWATEGVDQPWRVGEAIGVAMRAFRERFASLVLPFAGYFLLIVGTGAAVGAIAYRTTPEVFLVTTKTPTFASPAIPTSFYVMVAIAVAVGLFVLAIGTGHLYEAALAAVRGDAGEPGRFKRALRTAPRIFLYIVFVSLVSMVPLVGLLLTPLAFTPFVIVDENAKLLHALRKSWRLGTSCFGALWIYGVALAPLTVLGFASSIFTILTVPFSALGLAYGYARATGRSDIPWFAPEFSSRSIRVYLRVTLLALLTLFAGFVFWVTQLPTLRGAAWSVKDTAIRAGAIVCGVASVIVLLALTLPTMLDRLEGNAAPAGTRAKFGRIRGGILGITVIATAISWVLGKQYHAMFGVAGVVVLVVLVSFALDRLQGFTTFVAARHVRSQKSGFLTVISILSICGVAISSCALSSVVSVMGGFSQDLKRKILGNNAHIVVDTTAATPFENYDATLAKVRAVPGVTGATPVVRGEVMASSSSNLAGVIVTGIDPKSILGVVDLVHNIEVGKLDYLEHSEKLTRLPPNEVIGIGPGGEQYYKMPDLPTFGDDIDPSVRAVIVTKTDRPGIILGRELAKTLHVYVGDEITLVSPLGDLGPMGVMPRTKKFRVAAIFYSGMYEYDATYVYTLMNIAQDYFQTGNRINAIEIKVEEAERAETVTPAVVAAVGRPELRVRDWREINKNLFSALKLERFATFIILSIAICVASFCIVCTLLLMVTEKGKEIAILKAIGASDGVILRVFMIEGMIIGGIGTVFGVVSALAGCAGLSWFGLRLDPEVYYIDRLPISVNGWDFLTVALAALTICTLSTLYPAYAASRLRPVDGLRYE